MQIFKCEFPENLVKIFYVALIIIANSCTVPNETVQPQSTAKSVSRDKAARKSPIANTITLRTIVQGIGKPPQIMVSFDSEKLTERKGWDGTVKGGSRHTPFHNKRNFVLDESGIILTELSPDDVAPGNPAYLPGTPIGGVIVKGGKSPGGQMKIMKTDENGEVELPEEWTEGEFLIQIESKTQNSEFILTIGNEKITPKIAKESHGKISNVDAPNMLVNQDGTIRNFYYEEDFQLHSDIAKYLGVEVIIIAKGYYPVDYLYKKEGGNVKLIFTKKQKQWLPNNFRFFEGTNPKGQDCKGYGTACFYNAERGIDKKDIRRFTVKPVLEKELLVGVEIQFLDKLDTILNLIR